MQVWGWQEKSENWLGEYFNVELLPGLTGYFDASEKKGNSIWRPVPISNSSSTIAFQQTDKYSGKWVAIDQAKLIAYADTLQELNGKTEVKTAKHPLFFLVPRPEEEFTIL